MGTWVCKVIINFFTIFILTIETDLYYNLHNERKMYIYIQWNNKSTTCGISLNLKRSCSCMILISNFLKAKSVGKQNNNTMCVAFLANLTSSTGNIDLTKYNCLQLVIIQRTNVICPMRNFDPCKKWNVQYLFYLTKYFYGNIYVFRTLTLNIYIYMAM